MTQLEAVTQRETTLRSQVHGLTAKEKDYCERIHKLESSGGPPVPKPRTSILTPQLASLQAEIDRLKAELDKSRTGATVLREKIEKEREHRTTVEKTLERKNTEYQELVMKYNTAKAKSPSLQEQGEVEHERLTKELSQLRVTENSTTQNLRQKDQQLQRLVGEKNDLQMKVATLEKQRMDELAAARHVSHEETAELRKAKSECEGKIANLTEQLRLATPTTAKGSGSSSAMARRLNDALGSVKELETVSCLSCDVHMMRNYETWLLGVDFVLINCTHSICLCFFRD